MAIREEFRVHILNEKGIIKAEGIAALFTLFLSDLELMCGDAGREISIVRTKLEEASFFAKKAMASRKENQRTE